MANNNPPYVTGYSVRRLCDKIGDLATIDQSGMDVDVQYATKKRNQDVIGINLIGNAYRRLETIGQS